jgi:hypothetical protein
MALVEKSGAPTAVEPPEFGWMAIEQPGRVKVSSASRDVEPAWRAVAIHDVPQARIRRSDLPPASEMPRGAFARETWTF